MFNDIKWQYYVAALLEGEGSFFEYNAKYKMSSGEVKLSHITYVRITQKHVWVLNKMIRMFNPHGHIAKHPNGWLWTVTGSTARGILLTIYYLLSPHRKNKARKAMNDWLYNNRCCFVAQRKKYGHYNEGKLTWK